MARPLSKAAGPATPALSTVFLWTRALFQGAGFAAFALALLISWKLFLLSLLLLPADSGPLADFTQQFRIWCFGLDPQTGRIEWGYAATMILEPLLLGTVVLAVWAAPLKRRLRESPRSLVTPGFAGLAVTFAAGILLFALNRPAGAPGDLEFPARQLRTGYPAPKVVLTDQRGQRFDLASLRGEVVLLTAAYTSCVHTCPAILQVARRVARAAASEHFHVVAVTLDPATDDVATLAEFSRRHEMPRPQFRFLTGPPESVNRVLDSMEVPRSRDPKTGVISHPNVFLLIDREGRVAYRFGLGELQERWMTAAVRLLLAETAASESAGGLSG